MIILLSYFILAEFPGSVTINTPVTLQNISGSLGLQATIATLDDNTNVTNVTFEFDNGNGTWQTIGINDTENLTVYAFNWVTTAGGADDSINFTINITALFTNQTNFTSSGLEITSNSSIVENVTVDNTAPTITLNEPTNNAIVNTTPITFNFTAIDTVFTTINDCNLTLDPTNSSDGSIINTTTNIANGTETIFINTVPDGSHTWNVICTDSVDTNNTGLSENFTFVGGATAPSLTLDLLDKDRKSATTFKATDKVIIACTRSDEDGINETIISMGFPGISGPSIIEKATELTAFNDSRTIEVEFTETRELGDYLAICEVSDVEGNTNSTNLSFTVVKKLSKSTSAFANKAFKRPVAKIKIGAGSTTDVGKLTTDGESRLMQKGAILKFNVQDQEHTMAIKEATENAVTITVASTPFDVVLNAGESKNIDVNQDKVDDVKVTFHKLFNKHADITIALLSPEEQKKESREAVETKKPESFIKTAKGGLIITILVILSMVVIGYFLMTGRKR